MWFPRYTCRQADRRTNRHNRRNTPLPFWERSNWHMHIICRNSFRCDLKTLFSQFTSVYSALEAMCFQRPFPSDFHTAVMIENSERILIGPLHGGKTSLKGRRLRSSPGFRSVGLNLASLRCSASIGAASDASERHHCQQQQQQLVTSQ